MEANPKYNGWTNYETWCVNLWLTNEEGSDTYCRERAQECYDEAEADQTFSKEERAALTLADLLKEEHEEGKENIKNLEGTVFADLLNAALSEVNWYEIAEGFLSDVDKETTEQE